jgi:hypothetical protein
MSPRGCNSPSSTGEEAAWANANYNSGNHGGSSRSMRCHGSSRRAAQYRRTNEQWAAQFGDSTTNNKIKHEAIMKILDRRTSKCKRHSVTDQEIEQWVADEEWVSQNVAAINVANFTWGQNTSSTEDPPLGNVPSERPESSFRLLSVHINSLFASRRKNIKAAMLQWIINWYEVNLVGIGELGLNMSLMPNGHRLLSIFSELGL